MKSTNLRNTSWNFWSSPHCPLTRTSLQTCGWILNMLCGQDALKSVRWKVICRRSGCTQKNRQTKNSPTSSREKRKAVWGDKVLMLCNTDDALELIRKRLPGPQYSIAACRETFSFSEHQCLGHENTSYPNNQCFALYHVTARAPKSWGALQRHLSYSLPAGLQGGREGGEAAEESVRPEAHLHHRTICHHGPQQRHHLERRSPQDQHDWRPTTV